MVSVIPFFIALVVFVNVSVVNGKLKEGDCEVCIKFLTKYEKLVTDEERKDQNILTTKLKTLCGEAKRKENRFCYYIGGTEDAATYILNSITKPLSYYKSVDKICEELKKKDKQICELQYDKPLDWKNINLKKMRVKELKKILSDWDETCKNCLEKSEFIKKIESVKNKHVEL